MTEKRTDPETDATFRKGLALWLSLFAVIAFVAAAVFAFGFQGLGRAPPAMDDLHVSNDDEETHAVHIQVFSANGSDAPAVFTTKTTLEPGATATFDGATAEGTRYRLVVTVDDREPRSFEIDGPDDYCTTSVDVESTGAVEVVMGCA